MARNNELRMQRSQVKSLNNRLASLNPFAVLQRGYAIVSGSAGQVVSSVKQVRTADQITIKVSDGTIQSQVIASQGGNNHGKNG
jgi:exodeoxyribonuclease VII large subunit